MRIKEHWPAGPDLLAGVTVAAIATEKCAAGWRDRQVKHKYESNRENL